MVKRPAPVLDAAALRRLAVQASCDPRTIAAVAKGRKVKGLAGERARQALLSEGFDVGHAKVTLIPATSKARGNERS